jgi:hypothetical protein
MFAFGIAAVRYFEGYTERAPGIIVYKTPSCKSCRPPKRIHHSLLTCISMKLFSGKKNSISIEQNILEGNRLIVKEQIGDRHQV